MNDKARISICLAAALASSACSTKPRTFSATVLPAAGLAAASAGQVEAFNTCDQLVRAGHTSEFAAVAASGAATGAALVGGTGAIAASGTIGIGATAAGTVMLAALPFVGIAAGFGVNRLIRSGREKKYKRTMTACMGELGYEVVDWTRARNRQPGTAALAETVQETLQPTEPLPEQPVVAEPVPVIADDAALAAPEAQVAAIE